MEFNMNENVMTAVIVICAVVIGFFYLAGNFHINGMAVKEPGKSSQGYSIEPSCYDSDGQLQRKNSAFVAGYVEIQPSSKVIHDHCVDDKTLYERYCINNVARSLKVNCKNGCSKNACSK